MPTPPDQHIRRMKPGPFNALLAEAADYGIDTSGVSNERSSIDRLRLRIEGAKASGRGSAHVVHREIKMEGFPIFHHSSATTEQITRALGAYFMRCVDWENGGGDPLNKPKPADEIVPMGGTMIELEEIATQVVYYCRRLEGTRQ